MPKSALYQLKPKGWYNNPTELQFQSILYTENLMLSKRYESTEVDCRIWLHVPSGTPWSTRRDTHQVVKIQKETSTQMYTSY